MVDWYTNNRDIFSNADLYNKFYQARKGQALPRLQPYYAIKLREQRRTPVPPPPTPSPPDEEDEPEREIPIKKKGKGFTKDSPEAGLTSDTVSPEEMTDAKLIKIINDLDKPNLTSEQREDVNNKLREINYELEDRPSNNHIRFVKNLDSGETKGVLRGTNINAFGEAMNTMSTLMEKGIDSDSFDRLAQTKYYTERLNEDVRQDLDMMFKKDTRDTKMYKDAKRLIMEGGIPDELTGYSKGGGLGLLLGKDPDIKVPVHAINPLLGRQHINEIGFGENNEGIKITRTNTDPASIAIEGKNTSIAKMADIWKDVKLTSVAPHKSLMEGRNSFKQMLGEHALENITSNEPRVRTIQRNQTFFDASSKQDRLNMYKEMDKLDRNPTTYKNKVIKNSVWNGKEHRAMHERGIPLTEDDKNVMKKNYESAYGEEAPNYYHDAPGHNDTEYADYKSNPRKYQMDTEELLEKSYIGQRTHINAGRKAYSDYKNSVSPKEITKSAGKGILYGIIGDAGTDIINNIDPHLLGGNADAELATSSAIAGGAGALAGLGAEAVPEFVAGAFATEKSDEAFTKFLEQEGVEKGWAGFGGATVGGATGGATMYATGAGLSGLGSALSGTTAGALGAETAGTAGALATAEGVELTEAGAVATEAGAIGAEAAGEAAIGVGAVAEGAEIGAVFAPETFGLSALIGAGIGGGLYGLDQATDGGVGKFFEDVGKGIGDFFSGKLF